MVMASARAVVAIARRSTKRALASLRAGSALAWALTSASDARWIWDRKYNAAGMMDRAIKQRMMDTIPLATPVTTWNVVCGTGSWRTTTVSRIIVSHRAMSILIAST